MLPGAPGVCRLSEQNENFQIWFLASLTDPAAKKYPCSRSCCYQAPDGKQLRATKIYPGSWFERAQSIMVERTKHGRGHEVTASDSSDRLKTEKGQT